MSDLITLTVTPRQVRIILASIEPLIEPARERALAETDYRIKQLAEAIYRDCRALHTQLKSATLPEA